MYSRNIPMAEKRMVCFQSKKVKIYKFFFISNNYYKIIYLVRHFEIFKTKHFLVYSGGQLTLKQYLVMYAICMVTQTLILF